MSDADTRRPPTPPQDAGGGRPLAVVLVTAGCLALGALVYALALGWDVRDAPPYSDVIPGPYAPWQVEAVLVATASVCLLAALRHPLVVVGTAVPARFSVAWLVQVLLLDPGPLVVVGLLVVLVVLAPFSFAGAFAGAFAGVGLRALLGRRRRRSAHATGGAGARPWG